MTHPPTLPQRLACAAAALALCVAATPRQPQPDLVAPWSAPVLISERPTVAVLPFEEDGAPDADAYFAAGLSDAVIRGLGRLSGLLALSWNAVIGRADIPATLDVKGKLLGARFVVAGAIRRPPGRLQVSVQLVDAERGRLVWRDRYDVHPDEVVALQNRIAAALADAMAARPTAAERRRLRHGARHHAAAHDLVLQARHAQRRGEARTARAFYDRALALAPGHPDALTGRAETRLAAARQGDAAAVAALKADAEKAIEAAPGHGRAHALFATTLALAGDHASALRMADIAVDLAPSDALALAAQGAALLATDRPTEAAPALSLALRVDPKVPVAVIANLGVAYYLAGAYDKAIGHIDRHFAQLGDSPVPYAILAAAYLKLGERGRASEAVGEVRRLYPDFSGQAVANAFASAAGSAPLLEALRQAGLD